MLGKEKERIGIKLKNLPKAKRHSEVETIIEYQRHKCFLWRKTMPSDKNNYKVPGN